MQYDPNINIVDLILRKRDGGVLTQLEIATLVYGYTVGHIPDYQVSAFLMATFLNGMNDDEMFALTDAMLNSGRVLDLSDIPGRKVDKHSTGGVGDKVSIPLAPIVAACGVPVPMISGRGLGHTGGTLDKLESIPGFSVNMDIAGYRNQLADIGLVMIGQTDDIAPADRKMYALRDVTGTVEFVPFIAASILSKKLAEGIDALVLDVKHGSGAFMQKESDARFLAETLVRVSEKFGKPAVALLTDMDQPLGCCAGNWPEIEESLELLQGGGPEDLVEVTMALAAEMLLSGGRTQDPVEARTLAMEAVRSGRAMDRFEQMVHHQGGSVSALRDPASRKKGVHEAVIHAPADAARLVARVDARLVGRAMVELGAGRRKKEDSVDPLAGVRLLKRQGDEVAAGAPIARLEASNSDRFEKAVSMILEAYSFSSEASVPASRLTDRYSNGHWMNP